MSGPDKVNVDSLKHMVSYYACTFSTRSKLRSLRTIIMLSLSNTAKNTKKRSSKEKGFQRRTSIPSSSSNKKKQSFHSRRQKASRGETAPPARREIRSRNSRSAFSRCPWIFHPLIFPQGRSSTVLSPSPWLSRRRRKTLLSLPSSLPPSFSLYSHVLGWSIFATRETPRGHEGGLGGGEDARFKGFRVRYPRSMCKRPKRVYDVYRLIQKYNKLVAKLSDSFSFFFKYIENFFFLPFR